MGGGLPKTGEMNWVPRVPRIPENSSSGVDWSGRVMAFGSSTKRGYGLTSNPESRSLLVGGLF